MGMNGRPAGPLQICRISGTQQTMQMSDASPRFVRLKSGTAKAFNKAKEATATAKETNGRGWLGRAKATGCTNRVGRNEGTQASIYSW